MSSKDALEALDYIYGKLSLEDVTDKTAGAFDAIKAALSEEPVDVEELKKDRVAFSKSFVRANTEAGEGTAQNVLKGITIGWEKCIDHLKAQGFKITRSTQ